MLKAEKGDKVTSMAGKAMGFKKGLRIACRPLDLMRGSHGM